jgi:hypothetical protein
MFVSTVQTWLGSVAPRTIVVRVTPRCNRVVVRVSLRPAGPSGSDAASAVTTAALVVSEPACAVIAGGVANMASRAIEPAIRRFIIEVTASL